LCERPLRQFSRVPVCSECLQDLTPLEAEYFCVRCHTPFLNRFPLDEQGCCALCRSGLRGFDAAYSFGAYEGKLRELIHLLKYSGIRTLAKPLGRCLSLAFPLDQPFDLVAPMPLHWLRLWRRGFNQAQLLAKEVSRRTGIPFGDVIRRTRPTTPQTGLTHARRRVNVAGAFSVKQGKQVAGLRILLVDDVMTTGTTASECARALKKAGAKYVALLTLARTDRRSPVANANDGFRHSQNLEMRT
jgi:ComF family protein